MALADVTRVDDPTVVDLDERGCGSSARSSWSRCLLLCTHYEPDFAALRATSTRIVLAAGVESAGQLGYRGAPAAAERLGSEPVMFPSDHGGFLGGEYGQAGDPDAFAVKLREVLAEG